MIYGVGTDIASVSRMVEAMARHGGRFMERILAEAEREDWARTKQPARFLAKRFAAKEAFAKAFGTGIRPPVTLHAIRIAHDPLGKPFFTYSDELASLMAGRDLVAHLSLSDEADAALAFVVIERIST